MNRSHTTLDRPALFFVRVLAAGLAVAAYNFAILYAS